MNVDWHGVFPATTTQYDENLNVDLDSTQTMIDRLIKDGVHGIIALGTVGENNSHSADEKRQILAAIIEVAGGRVPIITGVSEFTTTTARIYVRDAAQLGVDGLMVLPAMSYMPSERELDLHIRSVASVSDLPIMIYNNPAAYRVNIPVATVASWHDVETIVAIKESAEDTRRFTDLFNACGDRFKIFAGLDDVALEGLLLGACGWISGLTNVFPKESLQIWSLVQAGELEKALEIYRWFLPLLHLDAQPDLVQCIKLAEQVVGRGSERVRPPRWTLDGASRETVIKMIEDARATRPSLVAAAA